MKTIKLQKWGNSQGVRIPKSVLAEIGITDTEQVELQMHVIDGEIRISPALTPYQRLFVDPALGKATPYNKIVENFNKCVEENQAEPSKEIDWGPPVGKEIW